MASTNRLVQLTDDDGNNVYPIVSADGIYGSDGSLYDIKGLFTSVSEGKALVASAITDKGVDTAADATYQQMADNIHSIRQGYGNGTATVIAKSAISAGDTVILTPEQFIHYDGYSSGTKTVLNNGVVYWNDNQSSTGIDAVFIANDGLMKTKTIVNTSSSVQLNGVVAYSNNVFSYNRVTTSSTTTYYIKFDPETGEFSDVTKSDATGTANIDSANYIITKLLSIYYQRSNYTEVETSIFNISSSNGKSCGMIIAAHKSDEGSAIDAGKFTVELPSGPVFMIGHTSDQKAYIASYKLDSSNNVVPTTAVSISDYAGFNVTDGSTATFIDDLGYFPFIGIARTSGNSGDAIIVDNLGLYGTVATKDTKFV